MVEDQSVAREELGTKRVCPESGRKFYDLSKDPIVSPYTGTSYPLSFFEGEKDKVTKVSDEETVKAAPKAAVADTDDDDVDDSAELVSLEEADAEVEGEDIPDLDGDDDDTPVAGDDTFLEEEEEDGDDIGINVDVDEDEDED